jgi:AGCS family alanine or glycine:cation symporter
MSLPPLIQSVADAVFMPWIVVTLLGAGLFLTIRLRFVQFLRLGEAFRTTLAASPSGAGVLTPFQAFATALAASIGMGNIAGVATAIVSGGPGALFWIWAYGVLATAVKFSEAVLGVRFRVLRGQHVASGPMYYLRDGLRSPFLAAVYALVAGIACVTTTPFTQPNSMALVLHSQLSLPTWISGIVIALLTWLVIIGGVTSIGRAAEKLAPLKVGLYLVGGAIVILTHLDRVPDTLALVFQEAFSFRAATGGATGIGVLVAMRYGLARGVYANEAGYGTAGVVYGTARSGNPTRQGLNAIVEVCVISFITSNVSALSILLTGVWTSGATSTAAVAQAFDASMPAGGYVVAFCAFLFGYTTLIGWAYYGEQFFEYLVGTRLTMAYRWLYCLLIPFGAIARVEIVWAWGDLMNGLQVFPNVIGLIGLSSIAAQAACARLEVREAPR